MRRILLGHGEAPAEPLAAALRGFRRVQLEPGASQTVRFTLTTDDLAYWDPDADDWVLEPGPVEIRVGPSSADEDLVLLTRIRALSD
ncbi:MAG: fibronectin type III-like domain-contianing protein [Woeseiaceae bacterium]